MSTFQVMICYIVVVKFCLQGIIYVLMSNLQGVIFTMLYSCFCDVQSPSDHNCYIVVGCLISKYSYILFNCGDGTHYIVAAVEYHSTSCEVQRKYIIPNVVASNVNVKMYAVMPNAKVIVLAESMI